MTGWVGVDKGVIGAVGIAVEALGRIAGQMRVGLDEAGDFRIVVAGVVVIEAGFFVEDLARIALGDVFIVKGVFGIRFIAEGGIDVKMDFLARAVGDDRRRAEMVAVVIDQVGKFVKIVGEGLVGDAQKDDTNDQTGGEPLAEILNGES